ncbi:MAG TPA: carboxypeptidase regulatory-like domain-containing protein [Draconibacterium sp.]|nr:carboxypeptidase regulatory-like domain-containing protein [Draconibacterium sp.]
MKTRNKIAVIVLLVFQFNFLSNASQAMTIDVDGPGVLTGTLLDETTGLHLEFAIVDLYSASDSTLVAGTISNTDGSFMISMINTGEYFLEISYPGFEKKQIKTISISDTAYKVCLGVISMIFIKDFRKKASVKSGTKDEKNIALQGRE